MPLTHVDPHPALITIDLQNGIIAMPTVHPATVIVERTARLARAFRARGAPVVLVNVSGRAPGRTDTPPPSPQRPPDWTELAAELAPHPDDHRVTKQRWGAFLGTDLDAWLRDRGVTQVFLAGISTSIGVESTARSAYDLGYHVVLVTDAMTDRSAEAHAHSVGTIFPRLGETATTADVLGRLSAK